jgi:hypothetical protein
MHKHTIAMQISRMLTLTNDKWNSQPTVNAVPQVVIDLSPEAVVLVYNCYYMTNICKNANDWLQTPRGMRPHPNSELPNDIFGYDFNTGKRRTRAAKRRDHSCPGNWKDTHSCPEPDQRTVFRQDGPWWTTDLEPNTKINLLQHRRVGGRIVQMSNVRYTCDEFPPATWVEGGGGEDKTSPAQTRCAGFFCSPGTKAEQNCRCCRKQ